MKVLLSLLNSFWKNNYGIDYDILNEEMLKGLKDSAIPRLKAFLQWLIDNNHIEKIGEGDINDYIRYIATTEDPIQTLSDLIK